MPELGEIRKGRELGFEGHDASRKYIWRVCKTCGSGQWIRADNFRETCGSCSIKAIKKKWLEAHNFERRENNPNWKGGRRVCQGYIEILLSPESPFYPMVKKSGYIPEHRLVVAQRLGRCLERWEQVHHIDGNKQNNNDLNLVITTSHPLGYTAGYKQGFKDGVDAKNKSLSQEIRLVRLQLKLLQESLQKQRRLL